MTFYSQQVRQRYQRIFKMISEETGIPVEEITGRSRKHPIAWARHTAAYLLRDCCQMGYADIGRLLGGRDHSTAVQSYQKIQSLMEIPAIHPALHESILKIKNEINGKESADTRPA